MDSLIGKKVWTSFSALRLAVVTAEHKDPEYWQRQVAVMNKLIYGEQ